MRSNYAAVTIFAANRASGPSSQIDASEAEDALITRPQLDVAVRHLPQGGAIFINSLINRAPLGDAAATALEACPFFDIGAAIAGMLEAGAFTAAVFGDLR